MRTFKEQGFRERLETAAKAKHEALRKFAERKAEDDPAARTRKATRLDAAKARAVRAVEREAKKLGEKARLVEERAKQAAQAEVEAAKTAERQAALAEEQKAARRR
jgi:hypothetical protein